MTRRKVLLSNPPADGPVERTKAEPAENSAGQGGSVRFVVLVAKQLAGSAVEEVEPRARRAGYRFVLVLAPAIPLGPVLHLQIGSGANENQVHSALIGASRHETMICRKILPP